MKYLTYIFVVTSLLLTSTVSAEDFSLDWWTIDNGGALFITGGSFELSGTIGQPDAGTVLTGGEFELSGGFWPGAVAGPAICRGDLNCDDWIDFNDINPFILALSNWPEWKNRYPDCPERNADVNGDGLYGGAQGFDDINPFIKLLGSSGGQKRSAQTPTSAAASQGAIARGVSWSSSAFNPELCAWPPAMATNPSFGDGTLHWS